MPLDGYLQQVRDLCDKYDTLLIFDEVMTGFRVAFGGAQSVYNVKPDLTCLGKIIGAGLPVGAYGGKKEIMQKVAPAGPMYQAGTLSGNPLAMAAGIALLKELTNNKEKIYSSLDAKAQKIAQGIEQASVKHDVPVCLTGIGAMMCIFFTDQPVLNYDMAKKSNIEMFNSYFWNMMENGIYLPPSQFEAFFLSDAHTEEDIQKTITAIDDSFNKIAKMRN